MERAFAKPIRELLYYGHKSNGQVVVFDDQSYRRQDVAGEAGILNSFDSTDYLLVSRLAERRCEPGSYPWDFWQSGRWKTALMKTWQASVDP
jgi:hypothetical protein